MSLDDVFREQIGKRPREAKSHFEVVDPGSWRLDRQDALIGLGVDWVGPFRFDLDGVTYEAFGLRSRIVSSQRQFLADRGFHITKEDGRRNSCWSVFWHWQSFVWFALLRFWRVIRHESLIVRRLNQT